MDGVPLDAIEIAEERSNNENNQGVKPWLRRPNGLYNFYSLPYWRQKFLIDFCLLYLLYNLFINLVLYCFVNFLYFVCDESNVSHIT